MSGHGWRRRKKRMRWGGMRGRGGRSGEKERVKGDRQPANLTRPSRDFLVTPVVLRFRVSSSPPSSRPPLPHPPHSLLPHSCGPASSLISCRFCFLPVCVRNLFFPGSPRLSIMYTRVSKAESSGSRDQRALANDWLDKLLFSRVTARRSSLSLFPS